MKVLFREDEDGASLREAIFVSFSFVLKQKRKKQREKFKAAFTPLLADCVSLRGFKLASLKQKPLLTQHYVSSLDAP